MDYGYRAAASQAAIRSLASRWFLALFDDELSRAHDLPGNGAADDYPRVIAYGQISPDDTANHHRRARARRKPPLNVANNDNVGAVAGGQAAEHGASDHRRAVRFHNEIGFHIPAGLKGLAGGHSHFVHFDLPPNASYGTGAKNLSERF